MSNALAIAGVTAVLVDLLRNALIDSDELGEVTVSALPPDQLFTPGQPPPGNQLNLFLYRLTPNLGWRNNHLPSRATNGDRLTNPFLALDLHYLLTAYGASDFEAEILLGYAMLVMHETPVLPRDAIRRALEPPAPVTGEILPAAMQTLAAADLADQFEQIRITPEYLEADLMGHLWSAQQTPYRLSTGYLATVVLLESRRSTRSALPVRSRNLYAVPFAPPVIERVSSAAGPTRPVLPTFPLVINGRQLAGQITRVRLGEVEITPPAGQTGPESISVDLSVDLRAGVQGVQVVHLRDMGTPPLPHRSVESNIVAFVLHPVIRKEPDNNGVLQNQIVVANLDLEDGVYSADVTVSVQPMVGKEQRVYLLLNRLDAVPVAPARAYSFAAQPWANPAVSEIEDVPFQLAGVEPGRYLVRVQVDGAASPLDESATEYTGPLLEFP